MPSKRVFHAILFILILVLAVLPAFGATNTAPSGGEKDAENGILYYFNKGGIFMWALLFFSLAGLTIVIERMIVISRVKRGTPAFERALLDAAGKGQLPKVRKICEDDDSETARILLSGLNSLKKGPERMERVIEATASLQVSIMERGLNILSSLAHLAPLVGFLGTVSGMITAFSKIASAENVSAKLVAGGIFEALITTASGLIVAIPILVFHNFFVHRVDRFVTEVERLSLEMMERLGNKGKL